MCCASLVEPRSSWIMLKLIDPSLAMRRELYVVSVLVPAVRGSSLDSRLHRPH